MEKSKDGASELYPVTDLKVRREENVGRNYLNGVYGAIPKPAFHSLFARIIGGAVIPSEPQKRQESCSTAWS